MVFKEENTAMVFINKYESLKSVHSREKDNEQNKMYCFECILRLTKEKNILENMMLKNRNITEDLEKSNYTLNKFYKISQFLCMY